MDLVFEVEEFNFAVEHYLRLGEKLGGILASAEGSAQAEFTIRRCIYLDKNSWGYYATLFLHAYGKTSAGAAGEGSRALEALGRGLSSVSSILQARAAETTS